jgi:hypothetical protein
MPRKNKGDIKFQNEPLFPHFPTKKEVFQNEANFPLLGAGRWKLFYQRPHFFQSRSVIFIFKMTYSDYNSAVI